MHDLNDTIVAVSSASGGVRSIVRVSGPEAVSICGKIFQPSPRGQTHNRQSALEHRAILPGCVHISDALSVDALLYSFLSPRSYTGQDLIELHVHAGPCLVEALLERLLAAGCRLAGPGEFTARAYLHGKLDLAQAEAVNEIVHSSNLLQLEAAERLLGGRLTDQTGEIRTMLLDLLSLIEAGLDFSGEDIEFLPADQAVARLAKIQGSLEDLLAASIRCQTLMDLPSVGIAGAPNAGKSSLLNALLGWERSIVSPQAGTTRDVLTAVMKTTSRVNCQGSRDESRSAAHPTSNLKLETSNSFQCVLFDCAGLIRAPACVLEELAQRAAIEALQRCTLVLFCVDSAKADWSEDLAIRTLIRPGRVIYVATKSDLNCRSEDLSEVFGAKFLAVSATTRAGLEELVQAIRREVCRRGDAYATVPDPSTPHGVATNEGTGVLTLTARHRQAVTEAVENVRQAITEVRQGREEVAAMMIRAACEAISGIEREPLDEQILERIFSRFCVGK
ncbi:MAG TPA: tRNA modification GTPase [Sedimentisphaerales bacterium]|nr:tRNA modification GTPase [Sedimentisphaerales bacterium]HQG48781.1 tRNA modification GTPase [Sedimentisphaerales bacterium]